jgi:hypothetical protein
MSRLLRSSACVLDLAETPLNKKKKKKEEEEGTRCPVPNVSFSFEFELERAKAKQTKNVPLKATVALTKAEEKGQLVVLHAKARRVLLNNKGWRARFRLAGTLFLARSSRARPLPRRE